ncbi:MAG: hypothetical protein A2712_07935 [Deltaproteobacteria bacterium RIFCSPHIGHO2_01_FULL_43_49]|nr:MAG: hypothetical protein A2712_07935 [Deltaproteobacteria bacterium RIFCSPHIGHO2_01_FULL_43_49]
MALTLFVPIEPSLDSPLTTPKNDSLYGFPKKMGKLFLAPPSIATFKPLTTVIVSFSKKLLKNLQKLKNNLSNQF